MEERSKIQDGTGGIVRRKSQDFSLAEMREIAEVMAESKMCPGWTTPAAIMTLMLLCRDEGTNITSAVLRYDNISNRICKRAIAMLDDFIQYGGRVKWVETSERIAKGFFTAPGSAEEVLISYTWEEAVRAGLHTKDNYRKHPQDMLRSRVTSRAMRMICPRATGLFYTPEEIDDITIPAPKEINVTPPPAPAPSVQLLTTTVSEPAVAAPAPAGKPVADEPHPEPTHISHAVDKIMGEATPPPEAAPAAPKRGRKPKAETPPPEQVQEDTTEKALSELFASLPQDKLLAFLQQIKWVAKGVPLADAKLTDQQKQMIFDSAESFKAKVNAMEVK